MKKTHLRWLVVLGIAAVAIAVWLLSSPDRATTPTTPTSSQQPLPQQRASSESPPTIDRPPHSKPGEKTATPVASGGAAQVLPEAIEAGTADVAPEKSVRLTPARLKQLNSGLATRASAPAIQGETTTARVTTPDNNTYSLTPNQVSNFERVYVSERDVVSAEVTYPRAREGQIVVVQVLDGGKLENGLPTKKVELGSNRTVSLQFQVTENRGMHRVRLTRGTDEKILDLWVGEPLPMRLANASNPASKQ